MWYFHVNKLLCLTKAKQDRFLFLQEPTLCVFVENLSDLPRVALPNVDNLVFGVFDATKKVSNSKTYTLYAKGFLRLGAKEVSFTSSQFVFHYRVGDQSDEYAPPIVTFLQDTI